MIFKPYSAPYSIAISIYFADCCVLSPSKGMFLRSLLTRLYTYSFKNSHSTLSDSMMRSPVPGHLPQRETVHGSHEVADWHSVRVQAILQMLHHRDVPR